MAIGQFQSTSLAIALAILVFSVIVIAIILYTVTDPYPPMVDACPDYWTTSTYLGANESKCDATDFGCCSDYATPKNDAEGSNCPVKCYNAHDLGKPSSTCTSKPKEMDFSGDIYKGSSGICNKQKWASECGITWDGITNIANAC
jgi:hypothetical protein